MNPNLILCNFPYLNKIASKVPPRNAPVATNSRPAVVATTNSSGAVKKAHENNTNAVTNQQIEELSSQVCVD